MIKRVWAVLVRISAMQWFKNFINYGLPILLCLIGFVEYTHIRPINIVSEDLGVIGIYSTDFGLRIAN